MKAEPEINATNYTAVHVGNGRFTCKLDNGELLVAGPSLRGMIRFTYFEDYSFPEIGWSVTREQLILDHLAKITEKLTKGQEL